MGDHAGLEKAIKEAIENEARGWVRFHFAIILLYPLAVIHLFAFLFTFSSREYLSGNNRAILIPHVIGLYVLSSISIAVLYSMGYSIPDGPGFAVMFSLLILLFVVTILPKHKKAIKLLVQYRELAMDDEYETVDQIAEAVGRKPHEAEDALRFLIDNGLLPVTIDEKGQLYYTHAEEAPMEEEVVAECGGCGAKMQLYTNEVVQCEYCGSPLKAS